MSNSTSSMIGDGSRVGYALGMRLDSLITLVAGSAAMFDLPRLRHVARDRHWVVELRCKPKKFPRNGLSR